MVENDRPHRFRVRLRTLLLIVAFLALLLVVIFQQVQIGRMQKLIDAGEKQKAQLTTIIRELRGFLERQR
jgi:C4-dicarboxylate-specific signal transduction histidine kinase